MKYCLYFFLTLFIFLNTAYSQRLPCHTIPNIMGQTSFGEYNISHNSEEYTSEFAFTGGGGNYYIDLIDILQTTNNGNFVRSPQIYQLMLLDIFRNSHKIFNLTKNDSIFVINVTFPSCVPNTIIPNIPTDSSSCGIECCIYSYTLELVNNILQVTGVINVTSGFCGLDHPNCINICPVLNLPTPLIVTNDFLEETFECENDCENPIKSMHTVDVTFGSSNCIITIKLSKTECEDGSVIVNIISIETNNYTECGSPGPGALMIQAISGLIVENPLDLTAMNQKFVYPSCWRYLDSTFTKAVKCETQQCCTYEIKYGNNCNRILPLKISTKGVNSCYQIGAEPLEPGCQNACFGNSEYIEQNMRDLYETN